MRKRPPPCAVLVHRGADVLRHLHYPPHRVHLGRKTFNAKAFLAFPHVGLGGTDLISQPIDPKPEPSSFTPGTTGAVTTPRNGRGIQPRCGQES